MTSERMCALLQLASMSIIIQGLINKSTKYQCALECYSYCYHLYYYYFVIINFFNPHQFERKRGDKTYIYYTLFTLKDTDQVCDELRAGGADVLNSVEDVHLLLHLHVFEHVAGSTQQSTATRSVPGHNTHNQDL